MTDGPLYLTASEAADLLGISVSSLYAYVSRKGIRTKALPGRKASLYWHEDILRIAKRKPETTSRDTGTPLVSATAITLLTSEGPFYRGTSSIALAESASFEEVAALLWSMPPSVFGDRLPVTPPRFGDLGALIGELSTIDQAIASFPLIEAANPSSFDLSPSGYAATGVDVLRWFAALLAGQGEPSACPIHLAIARRKGVPAGFEDIIRHLLILFADHELAPATYVVRAAANTGATPYQAIVAGLSASRGRRLLAGRTYAMRRLVDELVESGDPAQSIIRRFRDGEALPGFGDGIYPQRDLRAHALLGALARSHGDRRSVRRLLIAIEAARSIYGREPDFAIPFIFVERELGFRHNDGALATMGRLAGWIAHAAEQYQRGPMIRFGAAYDGDLPTRSG